MTSLDSARETIALFDRNLAQEETATRLHVERLVAAGLSYDSEQVREAWSMCAAKTRPLRDARENLVKAIATIVGMVAPAPELYADRHQAEREQATRLATRWMA